MTKEDFLKIIKDYESKHNIKLTLVYNLRSDNYRGYIPSLIRRQFKNTKFALVTPQDWTKYILAIIKDNEVIAYHLNEDNEPFEPIKLREWVQNFD